MKKNMLIKGRKSGANKSCAKELAIKLLIIIQDTSKGGLGNQQNTEEISVEW